MDGGSPDPENVFAQVDDVDNTELVEEKTAEINHPLESPEAHQNDSLLGRSHHDHSRFSDKQRLNLSKNAPSNKSAL